MALLAIVSIAASVSAMTIAGPRVYFAMARDRVFFRRAAVIHPVYGTPAAAIVAQALWSAGLVLTGSFDSLFTYTGFAVVLFSGIAGVALFVLRWRRPDEPSPFRAWGYPADAGAVRPRQRRDRPERAGEGAASHRSRPRDHPRRLAALFRLSAARIKRFHRRVRSVRL